MIGPDIDRLDPAVSVTTKQTGGYQRKRSRGLCGEISGDLGCRSSSSARKAVATCRSYDRQEGVDSIRARLYCTVPTVPGTSHVAPAAGWRATAAETADPYASPVSARRRRRRPATARCPVGRPRQRRRWRPRRGRQRRRRSSNGGWLPRRCDHHRRHIGTALGRRRQLPPALPPSQSTASRCRMSAPPPSGSLSGATRGGRRWAAPRHHAEVDGADVRTPYPPQAAAVSYTGDIQATESNGRRLQSSVTRAAGSARLPRPLPPPRPPTSSRSPPDRCWLLWATTPPSSPAPLGTRSRGARADAVRSGARRPWPRPSTMRGRRGGGGRCQHAPRGRPGSGCGRQVTPFRACAAAATTLRARGATATGIGDGGHPTDVAATTVASAAAATGACPVIDRLGCGYGGGRRQRAGGVDARTLPQGAASRTQVATRDASALERGQVGDPYWWQYSMPIACGTALQRCGDAAASRCKTGCPVCLASAADLQSLVRT